MRLAFDYRTADRDEVMARAGQLRGRTIGDIAGTAPEVISAAATKGHVGAIVESYFGILPNSVAGPDFTEAGIELKTVPVVRRGATYSVKERTFITMIDYGALAAEEWHTASIRRKLAAILLVFYDWRSTIEISDFVIVDAFLWEPSEAQLPFLRSDWERVRDKVRRGEAHLISEGDGRILGAATKAATGATRRSQPFSREPARPRGWALKPSFTRALLVEIKTHVPLESLIDRLHVHQPTGFEDEVLATYGRYVGRTVGEVASSMGIGLTGAKHDAARILRRALGQARPDRDPREFLEQGIEVKMVRVDATAQPYEAMSFPAFRYQELLEEEWEDSDLLARLNRFLFLPLEGPKGLAFTADCRIREPFFWSASALQLNGIRTEWEAFRREIAAGRATSLTPASATSYIHVRPKARDSRDTDMAPVVGPVVKKCFWLNRDFVQRLLIDHSRDYRGRG